MTAPNLQLLPLIHRHLKEHGFLKAADELQKKLSPQEEAPTSTTLLDIYTAWSKSSKRRKNPATSKKPPSEGKKSTPKKAAERKKTTNKTKKQSGSPNKKATPTKRKPSGRKNTKKVIKPNKSDALDKEAADGEDSDSSLDEEKWKKLVREMTDSDLVKVEAFNALIAPEPKKQRVRKPRAKPKPKTETPINGQGPQNAKLDKSTDEVLAETNPTKKSRAKKAAPAPALNSSNKEEHAETPEPSVISTTKRSPEKEKRKASDQASLEPMLKKKKVTIKSNISSSATDVDVRLDKITHNGDSKMLSPTVKSPENTPNLQKEHQKKKKKRTTENVSGDDIFGKNSDHKNAKMDTPTQIELKEGTSENLTALQTEVKKKKRKKTKENPPDSIVLLMNNPVNIVEDLNGNLPPKDPASSLNSANTEVDSVIKIKKKKKKKDKAKDEVESEPAVEAKTNSEISADTCEKTVEESSPNAAEIIPKKKKKKRDKNKEESEVLQPTDAHVADDAVQAEENTEEVVVKKKSKKKKKQKEEHSGTEDKTLSNEDSEITEAPQELSFTPQTPDSKKKRQKLKSEKLVEADTVQTPTQDSDTPKKKKKSSKSKETES